MKRNILLISLLVILLSVFAFCTGGTDAGDGGEDGPITDHETKFDKYFEENIEIWNNVWVHSSLQEDPNSIEYSLVIGVTDVEYTEIEGEERLAVSYKLITDLLPGSGWGQDRKTITIRQGEAFPSGREPQFRCRGGNERNEETNNGLIDYTGAAYTSYKGLAPSIIEKEVFENEILAKVSDEDKDYLLGMYHHGSPPEQLEAFRFEGYILNNVRGEDKTLIEEAYKKERKTARWYDLQEGVDAEKVLDILATVQALYVEETYDYRKYYIRKWDLVEQPENEQVQFLFLGMSKEDWQRCVDLFYEIGYVPSLRWTLYFETVAEDRQSGETRMFDPYEPFRLKENCTTGCYDFKNIWIKGEVPGYEAPVEEGDGGDEGNAGNEGNEGNEGNTGNEGNEGNEGNTGNEGDA
jgi:hypothetical protein